MTQFQTAKLVAVLLAAYPQALWGDGTPLLYERMLADLDAAVAKAAVEQLIATSRYLPTVAEIRAACVELTVGPRRFGAEAWGEVLTAIGRFGHRRTPGVDFKFGDTNTTRAVIAFGWRHLCSSENPIADRARFIELYDQLDASTRKDLLTATLPSTLARAQLRGDRTASGGPLLRLVLDAITDPDPDAIADPAPDAVADPAPDAVADPDAIADPTPDAPDGDPAP